jgi:transmembrane protein 222
LADQITQANGKATLGGLQKCAKSCDINPEKARFPNCIVWTPLPLISWVLPFIGHTGIGGSDGVLHDFQGPYSIGIDDLAFGETHK